MLGVVSFVSLIDWADRSIIGVVIEPIREEFGFSDTQMGLLSGFAFVILYVVAGIIFGRIADRWKRRNLLAIALTVWSVMTLLFGLAKSFVHLFLARIGIGAGTAGTNPSAISMISDVFPASRRAFALGWYQVGGVVGFSFGVYVGGAITQQFGWRPALISFGLLGLAVAILIMMFVDEPPRRVSSATSESVNGTQSMREVLTFMVSQKSLVHFSLASGFLFLTEGVNNTWTITYFVRSFQMDIGEASSLISVLWLISGLIGTIFGGAISDWLFRRKIRWSMQFCIAIAAGMTILSLPLYLSESRFFALAALFFHTLIYSMFFAPILAIPVALLKNRMRATGYAIVAFFRYMLAAVGPLYVGFFSDRISPMAGTQSLRYAMLSSSLFLLWAIIHFHRASRTFEEDYQRAGEI